MNKRLLIIVGVCLLILLVWRWVFFEPSSRLSVIEPSIQLESQGDNVFGLSPISKVDND
jgi:hypothetical protein